MKFRFFVPALVALFPFAASPAAEPANPGADALQERIIAHARTVTAEDYASTRTVWTEARAPLA